MKIIFLVILNLFIISCEQQMIEIGELKSQSAIEKSSLKNRLFLITNQSVIDTNKTSNTSDIVFSITPQTLPAGLIFNTNTGSITGTPTSDFTEQTFIISGTSKTKEVKHEITLSSADGFQVDSTVTSTDVDANPGDGVCETATAGECSFTAAIMEAVQATTPKLVVVDEGTFELGSAINITNALTDVTIQGQGMGKSVITGNNSATVNFNIDDGELTVKDITFEDFGDTGSTIDHMIELTGTATLNLENTVIQNSTTDAGAIIQAMDDSTLNIDYTFFYQNVSTGQGIVYTYDDAEVDIKNVVWYKNDGERGGCAEVQWHSDVKISNSICFDNHTRHLDRSAISVGTCGCPTDLNIKNTIISNNTHEGATAVAGFLIGRISSSTAARVVMSNLLISDNSNAGATQTNCFVRPTGGTITDNGYNLFSNNDCTTRFSGTNLYNQDPLIVTTNMSIEVGKIPTLELSTSSPAIDAGNNTECTLTDHRGLPRPVDFNGLGANCDIGAIEVQL